jgi:hypothetical protein
MGRPKKEEPNEPEFVGPPLIPGKPAFYRWIGYFDISDEQIAEIKKSLTPEDLEMLRGIPDFDPDAIIPGRDDPEER